MTSRRTEKLLKYDREHIVGSRWAIGGNNGIVLEKGYGIYLQDTEGKTYIDSGSQLICVNLGYSQQEIINAVRDEMEKLPFGMLFFGFTNDATVECARKLSGIVPPGLDHFNFTTSGSGAVELAIRMSRLYSSAKGTGKYKIVALYDSYHGTAGGGLGATGTGRGGLTRGVAPIMPGFIHIPSYYCYRCMFGLEYPNCDITCARYLNEVIEQEGAGNVAAFIAEPEMGASGMIAPPPEYWPLVREICRKHDVLFIADEVMCGFGRTGKMFTVEHWNIRPDIITMSKGITGAYMPFGAVAFSAEIWQALTGRGLTSYTFAGHPASAAAAAKAIEIYRRDKVAENAAEMGKYAMERLQREFLPLPCVGEVNGLGLMIGIEIVADKKTRKPFDPKLNIMQRIQDEGLEKGIYLRVSDIGTTPGDRIAFCPPLIITREEIDKALDILYSIVANLKP
ncbi:MAG: aminotransferase class III-fold pyridoxal phosphate-dependent enzyme [Dehalococcoidales bacterium]